jgi:hypothetical protein
MLRLPVVITLIAVALPGSMQGEPVASKTVTYSEAAMLLDDKKLINQHIELLAFSGEIIAGKLHGFSDGSVLLEEAPPVALCNVSLLRISRKVTRPLRRVAGIVGGIFAGALLGGSIGVGVAFSGAETTGLTMYLASIVGGGVVGSKLSAKRVDTVYLLDRTPPQCEDAILMPYPFEPSLPHQ